MKIIKIFSLISFTIITSSAICQDWNIPEAEKAIKMQIQFTEANQDAGKLLFDKTCKLCHGELSTTPVNKRQLPLAPNLGAKDIQSQNTDGEFHAKILTGKGGMPPFKTVLSEEDSWKIISYLRSFYPDYKPSNETGTTNQEKTAKFEGTIKTIDANYDSIKKQFIVKLTAIDKNGNQIAAQNVKVDLFVKRAFGYLPISAAQKTDANGEITVDDINIPTDTTGHIFIKAQTTDQVIAIEKSIAYGKAHIWKNPLDQREIWGTSAKSPLWIMISYISVTLFVWLVIFWAVFQLFRIKRIKKD